MSGFSFDPWGKEDHPPPDADPPPPFDAAGGDDAELARLDAAAALARDVELEAHRIRVREAAKAKVRTENAPPAPPFDAGLLAEILARPAEPPYRVEGLIPSDAGTLIVAQRKTGKTTL